VVFHAVDIDIDRALNLSTVLLSSNENDAREQTLPNSPSGMIQLGGAVNSVSSKPLVNKVKA